MKIIIFVGNLSLISLNPINMKSKYPKILATLLLLCLGVSCNEEDFLEENIRQAVNSENELRLTNAHINARLQKGACGEVKEVNLLAGQHTDAGSILAYNDVKNLYIEYITAGEWKLAATHLYVGKKENIPGTKNGNPKVGNFPYKTEHNPLTNSYTYTIPLDEVDACFVVAAHAEVRLIGSNGNAIQEETAWGEGSPMTQKGSWAMYFEVCKQTCIVEYPKKSVATLAFEDLYPGRGDADYNDLVVDMKVKEYYLGDQPTKIEMTFRAKARGAGYDHDFMIHLPIEGKASVEIKRYANQVEVDADNPYETENMSDLSGDLKISAFPSTKKVLPASVSFSANTIPNSKLVDSHVAKVVVVLKEDAKLLLPPPYDPILYVKNTSKEIHVLEITDKEDADGDGEKDYWEDKYGIHPFGILIPVDWAWPLEKTDILKIYSEFKYIKDGNNFKPENPDWYNNRIEGSDYFKPELFN